MRFLKGASGGLLCLALHLLPVGAAAQPVQAVTRLPVQETPALPAADAPRTGPTDTPRPNRSPAPADAASAATATAEPNEFERLATEANGGKPIWRLGTQARRTEGGLSQREAPARVPPHYVVQVGDEISVSVWGSVDAQWQLRVDRAGRLTLPRVGPLPVAGATAGELEPLLRARLERVFKGFELAAAVTDVSPVRVHITGFVDRPGDYLVPGLTTISGAIAAAHGPSGGGSYRRIRLVRDEATLVTFDLYSLLGSGSRREDRLLQPGDVLFVEAVGPQVAVLGSVNRPAVFEFLPGESVSDALRLAGSFSSVADRGALMVESLKERNGRGTVELVLPRDADIRLADGDILRVRSQVAAGTSKQLRNKRVLIEGEVRNPGEYLLPANATLVDAVEAAGGATPSAFLFGAALRRESVRELQDANFERALRDLEANVARNATTSSPQAEVAANIEAANRQLLARLRTRRPEGRLVLEVTPDSKRLPPIELEDGDRVHLPPLNQSVGVFGSVVNAGSFAHDTSRSVGDYVKRAGGPSPSADYGAAFVVRANGSVFSASQGSLLRRARDFEEQPALPGDTVFVPDEMIRASFVQGAKDWTQVLYQLGVGLAALFWNR